MIILIIILVRDRQAEDAEHQEDEDRHDSVVRDPGKDEGGHVV